MAKSAGLQLFPILFRGTTFESMPDGLQYMLVNCCVGKFLIYSIFSRFVLMAYAFGTILQAATNCIPFLEPKRDQAGMDKLLANMQSIFYNAQSFNADISKWNTGNVTSMLYVSYLT